MKLEEHRQKIDILFLFSLIALIGIGITLVYSATINETIPLVKTFWFRQIIYFVFGGIIVWLMSLLQTRFYYSIAYPFYFVVLLALIFVAIGGGSSSHGAGRWISLAGVKIQPSEFAKIAYLLVMSRFLSTRKLSLLNLKGLVMPGILFIVPFVLILKQPDLSTALVFVAMTLTSFYWSGMSFAEIFLLVSPGISVIATVNQPVWSILIILTLLVSIKAKIGAKLTVFFSFVNLSMGFASLMIWNSILKEHQRSRIMTFLDPLSDPRGAGYQVIQSKVAIGSGGLVGKGFGDGSQTNLSFLPEEHTDFIFSVLGEQFGFIGCAVVLGLYFIFITRTISICTIHADKFVNLVLVNACTIFLFHIFVNIAMTSGMMPVTGLPLPFLSYGGSFVLTCMILVGLIVNMRIKAHKF